MNFALSEEAAYLMTNAPTQNRSHAPEPMMVRTSSENREIASAEAVALHREEENTIQPEAAEESQLNQEGSESATQEVVQACTRACKGAVYDASHWADLPGETSMDKISVVMCRGGRLPYLLLTFSIGFFTFFAVFRIVSSSLRSPQRSTAVGRPPVPRQVNMDNLVVGPPLV